MGSLWFWIVAVMVAVYAVLDGFDLGAGAIYLIAAKENDERRKILRAIGPVWDGNEVWLLAGGGVLYFAFPKLYASSFSGFYLPLMMVLWLMILRAVGIEFRGQLDHPMWREFFDVVFSVSSALLALFFGVALGNVIRGVPLDSSGYFFEPLWTNFKLSDRTGILDWYTVLIGLVALVTITAHGSYYIALKTDADLSRRARGFALLCWPLQFFLSCSGLVATFFIRPEIMNNYTKYPVAILVPVIVFLCLGVMLWANPKGKQELAFVASSLFIVFMLVGAAVGVYPTVLPSRDRVSDLTIANTEAANHGLSVGLVWWAVGFCLAIAYSVYVYTRFKGKVQLGEGHY